MITKEFLEKSLKHRELIESSYEELKNLREISTNVQSINYGESYGNKNSMRNEASFTRIIDKISELEILINKDIYTMVDNLTRIREEINKIENNNERLVLKLRYLSHFTWQEIADKMGYSVMQVHRIHKKALLNFE